MKFDIPGLLGRLGQLPGVINQGLLGPLPTNPNMGLDPASVQQARQAALTDMATGMLAGSQMQNPMMGLHLARQGAQEGFKTRIVDMLKENEIVRMNADRTKQQQQEEAAAANAAAIEEAMRNAPPPPGLNIPPEAWQMLPWQQKATLLGQYVPPKPQGAMSVAPGSAVIDPATGKVIFKNPALPSSDQAQPPLSPGAFPKEIPAAVRQGVVGNEDLIRKIDEAIKQTEQYTTQNPGKSPTGPAKATTGAAIDTLLPGSPGTALIDYLDPSGVNVRAGVADIGSMKFHERSGAAVTVSESPRLRPFIPEGNKKMEVNVQNLKRLRDEAVNENKLILATYGVPYEGGQYTPGTQQGPQIQKNQSGQWVVTNDTDYDAVPKGEEYVSPDGNVRRKQ